MLGVAGQHVDALLGEDRPGVDAVVDDDHAGAGALDSGREGVALSFCAPDEKPYLKDIEKLIRQKLEPMPLPADFVKQAAGLPKPLPTQQGSGSERPDYAHPGEVGSHRRAMRPQGQGGRRGEPGRNGQKGQGGAKGPGRPNRAGKPFRAVIRQP